LGLFGQVRPHAVCSNGHTVEPAFLCFVYRSSAFDAVAAKPLHNLRVVDDIANRSDTRFWRGCVFNKVDGASNAPTIAKLLGDHNLALSRWGCGVDGISCRYGCHGGMSCTYIGEEYGAGIRPIRAHV